MSSTPPPSQSQPSSKPSSTTGSDPDTHGPAQLAESLPVIQNNTSTTDSDDTECEIIAPVRAKALLNQMTVTHETGFIFSVVDGCGTHTVNPSKNTCSCHSTLPERGHRCEHLLRLYELDDRDELPRRSLTELQNSKVAEPNTDTDEHKTNREEDSRRTIQCPHCDRQIGETERSPVDIAVKTCNVCALDDHDIYHFEVTESRDPELVYFSELICTGTADSYYNDTGAMSVYEFFANHSTVSRDDAVVLVHRRVDAPDCSGMLFESETTPVPASLLTKAIETLKQSPDDQVTQPEPDHPDSPVNV